MLGLLLQSLIVDLESDPTTSSNEPLLVKHHHHHFNLIGTRSNEKRRRWQRRRCGRPVRGPTCGEERTHYFNRRAMSKYLVSGPNASRVVIFVQPTLICVLTYAAAAPVGSERVAVLASRRHCGRAQEFHVHTHMRARVCSLVGLCRWWWYRALIHV